MRQLVQAKTGIGGTRAECYWEWSAYAVEKKFAFKIRLKLLTQVAARQKGKWFQIFGTLTENALTAMTTDV